MKIQSFEIASNLHYDVVIDFTSREMYFCGMTWKNLASKGESLYRKKIKGLISKAKGKFAAIDVQSEEFFIGATLLEALHRARQKYPNHKFHFVRIGFPAAVSHKYRTRP